MTHTTLHVFAVAAAAPDYFGNSPVFFQPGQLFQQFGSVSHRHFVVDEKNGGQSVFGPALQKDKGLFSILDKLPFDARMPLIESIGEQLEIVDIVVSY